MNPTLSRHALLLWACLLLWATCAAAAWAQDAAAQVKPEASSAAPSKARVVKDQIMQGDARCTRCHSDVNGDEVENVPILPIARTKHGTRADARTPTCTSCHGTSERHLKQEGKRRPLPDHPFGRKTAGDPLAHNKACLSCHEGGNKLMHWSASTHARRDVPCSDCHQVHVSHDKATTKPKVAEMCMSCHKEKKGEFARPNHHPVPEGKMTCTDCHNPHGSAGPKLMVKDSVNETCYSCHAQHRGPFLWNHLPVTQDCALCHNPHGSTTAGLLKMRPQFLCQQCHEPANHRGNVPGLNGSPTNAPGAGALTQARGCTNCHTQIHGGNNPTAAGTQRTFRR
jgi:DmsE family decaheme c-type cytochrome